ncbi:hypothetical protein GCM10010329_75340 [Streptomyces spiroverticillatus]|uniref:Uncharacterized protein n=1 Tax=Streptomyces finlayi TaxID=67296 RepID=A0A918X821_9ACTN|nr:hypothetical protein [Streptomyces finlayi]GHA41215.1 hypothetical protein GCM10010329_75340 [Streptomyces spiroverticillatus]GHD16791.1 hypothetical protein GCM10010334_78140 [Streptomyces finlayi]
MSSPGSSPAGSESLVCVFERWATTRGVENSSVKQYRSILARSVEPFFGSRSLGSVTEPEIDE